jgi:hypothetical protein
MIPPLFSGEAWIVGYRQHRQPPPPALKEYPAQAAQTGQPAGPTIPCAEHNGTFSEGETSHFNPRKA